VGRGPPCAQPTARPRARQTLPARALPLTSLLRCAVPPPVSLLPARLPRWIKTRVIADTLGCSNTTVLNYAKLGWLPQPRRLNARVLLWDTAAVRRALQRLQERGRLSAPRDREP
jgi:predicted DNA-binding transcriptional regulator AlpA